MYILINALKNIYRYKSRYILSGIFLLGTISVISCALYYAVNIPLYVEQQKYLHNNVKLKFREELQWNENEYSFMEYSGFNTDGSMDKYNYPINVKKEFFEQFAEIDHVKKLILAYTEIVNGVYDNEAILYGGSLDEFSVIYEKSGDRLVITEGKENEKGECLIHRVTAAEFNYNVDDYITYTDEVGNILGKMKISGFFDDYNQYKYETEWGIVPDSVNKLFRTGSNPFYSNMNLFRYLIITDFDTVYYMYGEDENSQEFIDRHEFNKYFAWYKLDELGNYDFFIQETEKYEINPALGFYYDPYKYNYNVSTPLSIIRTSNIFIIITFTLSGIVILMLTMYLLKERRYEIGVLYSLGVTGAQMIGTFLYEMLVYIGIITFLSVFTGKLLHNFTLSVSPYIKEYEIFYAPNIPFLLSLFAFTLIFALISVIIISIQILRASPSKLISYRES